MKRCMWKAILCSLVIVALFVAPMSALASSNVAYILKVDTSNGTYVRSGSGVGSNTIIGKLKNNTRVLYWGERVGQMLKIMTANGRVGYVYQGNLKSYGALKTSQIYKTNTSTTVYKRSGSSMKKSMSLGAGVPLILYNTYGDWAYVKNLNGKDGYVPRSAISRGT